MCTTKHPQPATLEALRSVSKDPQPSNSTLWYRFGGKSHQVKSTGIEPYTCLHDQRPVSWYSHLNSPGILLATCVLGLGASLLTGAVLLTDWLCCATGGAALLPSQCEVVVCYCATYCWPLVCYSPTAWHIGQCCYWLSVCYCLLQACDPVTVWWCSHCLGAAVLCCVGYWPMFWFWFWQMGISAEVEFI